MYIWSFHRRGYDQKACKCLHANNSQGGALTATLFFETTDSAMNKLCNVFSKLGLVIGVAAFIALLAGCSSSQKAIKVDEARVKEFVQHGYDSGIDYEATTSKFLLKVDNEFNQVTVVQPIRNGKYPLIIYLPGLGESSEAGKGMRNAWAKSGYVVLAIQPLKEDENIWSSDAALRAEFSNIRHERYSSEVISSRLNVLAKLLEYIKQGAMSGDQTLFRVDLAQIAVVGFDVGASTAMIASGEDVPNVSKAGLSIQPNVAIALSPHVDFIGAALDSRYQNISIPTLSVTSDADDETHEAGSISLHQVPFQHMPPGNKFLLLLSGASHALIGDADLTNDVQMEGKDGSKQTEHEDSGNSSGRSRGGRHGKNGSGSKGKGAATSRHEEERSPTQRAKAEVALEQVTTAFLNAYVKNDRFAIEWLNKDAQPWLYGIGQLQEK